MARTSSLNCLSCRNPYQTPHSLHPSPPFTENPFFFTEKCFVGSPAQKSALIFSFAQFVAKPCDEASFGPVTFSLCCAACGCFGLGNPTLNSPFVLFDLGNGLLGSRRPVKGKSCFSNSDLVKSMFEVPKCF